MVRRKSARKNCWKGKGLREIHQCEKSIKEWERQKKKKASGRGDEIGLGGGDVFALVFATARRCDEETESVRRKFSSPSTIVSLWSPSGKDGKKKS